MSNYNVTMSFNADTSKAKQQIESLQQTLSKLGDVSKVTDSPLEITDQIKDASKAALELQAHLEKAVNTKTGNIDFSKLDASLKSSGSNLSELSGKLLRLGPEGKQAFLQLANGIASAEMPLKRTNKLLEDFKVTMANTVKWQISSSMMHGFMGAVSNAYRYAQDLNESLTNIRIVTGQSTEQMAAFAEKANTAAKALSTTTTTYTDAALIFYQQGLGDEDVAARTEATIKMAQATGDSATEVSSYMTAIWNNFDDGSESMEHYADVITALGASTASSSSEIAEGLSKFASIAQTTGLSYEYATASLATLVAETRQSADTVGNSLKTIFSRLQGLSLGETLDDGTTLNKYSRALESVGVNIKDSNGALKSMDNILDELGDKWGDLAQDQKMALTQTVAGTRQYAIMISMMDNWEKVKKNINTAENADGTLDKQAKIYQESWEAAAKRVQAALEHIYTQLLDDKAFIKILNGLEKTISLVDKIISSVGGLKTILAVVISMFSKQLVSGAAMVAESVAASMPGAQARANQKITQAAGSMAQTITGNDTSEESKAISEVLQERMQLQAQYNEKESELNDIEKEVTKSLMEQQKIAGQKYIDANKELDLANKQLKTEQAWMNRAIKKSGLNDAESQDYTKKVVNSLGSVASGRKRLKTGKQITEFIDGDPAAQQKLMDDNAKALEDILKSTDIFSSAGEKVNSEIRAKLEAIVKDLKDSSIDYADKCDKVKEAAQELEQAKEDLSQEATVAISTNTDLDTDEPRQQVDAYVTAVENKTEAEIKSGEASVVFGEKGKQAGENLENAGGHVATWTENISSVVQAISMLTAGMTALDSAFESFSDGDLGGFVTGLMAAIPMILSGGQSLIVLGQSINIVSKTVQTATGPMITAGISVQAAWWWITVIVAGLYTLYKAYDYFSKTSERAANAIKEANDAYEEQEEKVKSLNSELETLNDRIDELIKKGSLTITKQEELTKLQAERAELEAQLELEKQLAHLRLEEKAASYVTNENNALKNIDKIITQNKQEAYNTSQGYKYSGVEIQQNGNIGYTKTLQTVSFLDEKSIEQAKEYLATYQKILDEGLGTKTDQENAKEQIPKIQEAIRQAEAAKNKFILDNISETQEEMDNLISSYQAWKTISKENGTYDEEADKVHLQKIQEKRQEIYGDQYNKYVLGTKDTLLKNSDEENTKNGKKTSAQILNELFADGGVEDAEQAAARLAESYTETFKEQLIKNAIDPQEYALKQVENYQAGVDNVKNALGDNGYQKLYNQLVSLGRAEDISLLSNIDLDNINFANLSLAQMIEYIDYLKGQKGLSVGIDAAAWKASIVEQRKIVEELENGDTISAEDFSKLPEEIQSAFQELVDGSYMLMENGQELRQQVEALADETMKQEIHEQYQLNHAEKEVRDSQISLGESLNNVSADSISTATSMFAGGASSSVVDNALGIDATEYIEAVNQQLGTTYKTAQEAAQGMQDYWSSLSDPAQLQELQKALAQAATTFEELDLSKAFISNEDYSQNFERIAREQAQAYNVSYEAIQKNAKALESSIEMTDKYKNSSAAANLTDEEKSRIAVRIALGNARMNAGIKDLTENWEKNSKALKENDKQSIEYSEAVTDIKKSMADILNVDISQISDEFMESADAMELIQRIAEGDMEAIDELRILAANADIQIALQLDDTEFQTIKDGLQQDIDNLNMQDIKIGATVDASEAFPTLASLLEAGQLTTEQIQAYFDKLGWEPNITYKKMTVADAKAQRYSGMVRVGDQEVPFDSLAEASDDMVIEVPILTSATYKGPSGSTASPPKSNAGSGGGGSAAKPKEQKHNSADKKNTMDEKERYHVIRNQLEDLEAAYDKVDAAKEKAFGPERLKNLQKEIAAQKDLIKANEQYLKEIQSYKAIDAGTMRSYGAQFDENGTITNYDALIQAQVDKYNQAVDTFNQAYTDDEGAKQAFEAAQKAYEQFQKDLKNYEESQDLEKEQIQAIIEARNKAHELAMEQITVAVDLKTNVSDDNLKYLQYALQNIENKAYDVAEAFGYLNNETLEYMDKSKAYTDGLRKILELGGASAADITNIFDGNLNNNLSALTTLTQKLSNGEGNGFTQADIEQIRNYVSEIISINQEMQELRKTVHEQINTVWSQWNDKMDTSISKITALQDITKSYGNIIDLVGRKSLGVTNRFMEQLGQQNINQANDRLAAEKARYESLKASRDDAYQTFMEQKEKGILSPEEVQAWEESLKQMDSDVQSAASNFQSAWENALTAINEAFTASVDRMIEAYSDAAAGIEGSISDLQEKFDRSKDLSKQYLDDYEKIYQFNKLNRDINKSIDETSNVKAKKELLAIQTKINKIEQSGAEVSDYEMKQLRLEYELKKAMIDMEEAQNAKSKVQMRRDSEGNFAYVYTADGNEVAKAEAAYADKLHEMQVANMEYIESLEDNLVNMEQEYGDKVSEIMNDVSLTAEERMVKVNEVTAYYDEKMKYYTSEAQQWQENSTRLYEEDWQWFAKMTGYKISAQEDWVDKWEETQLSILTGFKNIEDYQTNHDTNSTTLLGSAGNALSEWNAEIENTMNTAGSSIGTFSDDATAALKAISEESDKAKDSVVSMANEAQTAIEATTDAIKSWEDQYSETISRMLTWNDALVQSFNDLLRSWSGVETQPTTPGAVAAKVASYDTGGYTGSWGSSGRMIMAHEKELILNKDDTENFLQAVGVVRQISQMIDLNALTSSQGFGSSLSAVSASANQVLQQEVTVHAEFPNVTDRNQIEEAFNDIVNLASQYANRR